MSVKKIQENFQDQVNDLNQKVKQQQPKPEKPTPKKPNEVEGEYIDYEEIK